MLIANDDALIGTGSKKTSDGVVDIRSALNNRLRSNEGMQPVKLRPAEGSEPVVNRRKGRTKLIDNI
jgi:hypothetical protein